LVTRSAVGANEVRDAAVESNDIGGDRHENESRRAFAGGRIIFPGIDAYENGPAAFYEIVSLL
jgi:hypothetical protein